MSLDPDDELNPNHNWWPPYPPRRSPKERYKTQFVWPRDKKQKGAHTWSRFKDILTSKGPDIWIGKQGDIGPSRSLWSHWGFDGAEPGLGNLGYYDDTHKMTPAWSFGHRPLEQKYDFETRRYGIPHDNSISDIKWHSQGRDWLYKRNRYGFPRFNCPPGFAEEYWRLHGQLPFVYDWRDPYWSWYNDEW